MISNEVRFGKITELMMSIEQGIITDFNNNSFIFRFQSVKDEVSEGNLVGFRVEMVRGKHQRREAIGIQRAFMSKDNRLILDRRDSHLHLGVAPYLRQSCAQIICENKKMIKTQINFNQEIGTTICVPTDDEDEIVYIVREGRYGHSRFTLNRTPKPTKSLTVVLRKTKNYYKILTAYLGTKAEAEPWESRATSTSIDFWQKHAFVYGIEPVKEATMTSVCPWSKKFKN
jgi:hypothetical protein